jgi:hypothetical protein
MYKFYSLIQWLYPSVIEQFNLHSGQLSLDSFLTLNRNLLRSERDEGFILAIKCINDDVMLYLTSAKESDLIKSSLLTLNKQILTCNLLLADQAIKNFPRDFPLLSPNEKATIRAKLNKVIDMCLPTIVWTAFCDLYAYKELCKMQVHGQMAELLFLYALTFLPDQHSIIASSGLSYFIQLINPSQTVQDIHYERLQESPYLKTIEARREFSKILACTSLSEGEI